MIAFPSSVRVWLAVGRTDMRRGMNGLALQVQESLGRDPHAGDLSGDTAKILETMGDNKITAFGFRNYLFNANTVALQELANYGSETGFRQVDPIITLNTVSGNLS